MTRKLNIDNAYIDTKEGRPAGNSVYVAIAGAVVNRRSVLLKNFVLNGQGSAPNPLLHIHANRSVNKMKQMNRMTKTILSAVIMAFTMSVANAQSKKEQIAKLTFSLDSLNQVVLGERQNFSVTLDSLNQVLRKNQHDFKLEIEKSILRTKGLNTQLMRLNSINDSINTQLIAKDQKIDSLTLQIGALLEKIAALSSPQIDSENDWLMIERNLEVRQKDVDQAHQWLKMVVKPQELDQKSRSEFENIFTPNCYSYIEDAADFYWGYPGSIEEDEFKAKWHSTFDLKYAFFGDAFENGNCGWATMKLSNIDFLGVLNGGDWFKLTITGGCGENDYSQTLIRIVKVIEKNGSFKIANFLSVQDG